MSRNTGKTPPPDLRRSVHDVIAQGAARRSARAANGIGLCATTGAAKGTLERITVHGRALEGNLEGDSPDRPVVVYLPPSYAKDTTRRYPVLYFLHGYTATAEAYVKSLAIPDSIDRAVAAGAREMIVVIPTPLTGRSPRTRAPAVRTSVVSIRRRSPIQAGAAAACRRFRSPRTRA